MVRIISRKWFWKDLGEDEEFKVSYIPNLQPLLEKYEDQLKEFYYEVDGKGKFVLIPLIKRVIIPESSSLILSDIQAEEAVSFEDWKLDQTSPTPDPKYIRNQYMKHESFYISDKESISKLPEGSYCLKNDRTREIIEFSLKQDDKYTWDYNRGVYLCFPEKCEDVLRIKEINKKEFFIRYLIDGIRKADSRSDSEG